VSLAMSYASLQNGSFRSDLLLPHGCVRALSSKQFFVGALFNDSAGVQDYDLICVRNGREAMPGKLVSHINLKN